MSSEGSTSETNAVVPLNKLVTKMGGNDVLTGRGTRIDNNPGNIAFRSIVRGRKLECTSTNRQHRKQEIAEEIIQQILQRGGRFLRQVSSPKKGNLMSVSADEDDVSWEECDTESILRKVKQILRSNPIYNMSTTTSPPLVQELKNPVHKSEISPETDSSKLTPIATDVQRSQCVSMQVPSRSDQSLIQSDSSTLQRILYQQHIQSMDQQIRINHQLQLLSKLNNYANQTAPLLHLEQEFNGCTNSYSLNQAVLQCPLQILASTLPTRPRAQYLFPIHLQDLHH